VGPSLKRVAHPLRLGLTKDAVFRLCSRQIQDAEVKIGFTISGQIRDAATNPEWRRLQSVRFNGNKLGSAGGVSAMDSNSGNCCLSGSGTFTLEPFKMLMSCSALTTPFP
jgi:hypothetical protein